MSEPLIVKASEWNDAKLKQMQAVENKSLIKGAPDTFVEVMKKADLTGVVTYMQKIISVIAKAEPSEELAKDKQAVKKYYSKLEFLLVSKYNSLMEEI